MKKPLARALGAAMLTFSLATAAQATPFYLDFTGSITYTQGYDPADAPATGSAVAGGFNAESDRQYDAGTFGQQHAWVDFQPTNLADPLAFFAFGGGAVSFPVFPEQNYLEIALTDGCTPTDCSGGAADSFMLFASSADQANIAADFTGTYHANSLLFMSFGFGIDDFDAANVDPLSVASLPVHDMFGSMVEDTFTCLSGNCTNTQSRQIQFSVDSVSRGVGPRIAVPEPDTFALLAGAGLLFLVFSGAGRGFARRAKHANP